MRDVNTWSDACFQCIKSYKQKHSEEFRTHKEVPKFHIKCAGIPREYVDEQLLAKFTDMEHRDIARLLDPVVWAEDNLDWFCLDPTGEVWKRKNPEEYLEWRRANPDVPIEGHSRYHRPYQATMLKCSAKQKIFRIGRQAGKTETIVISMLFHMVTRPGLPEHEGFKIVVIAPYQSQIDLIFTRIRELISSSPTLKNSIFRSVKAPQYMIELNNGSKVTGFTAGTKSGSGAGSARGQHAHMLIFDEADYLDSNDMDAAFSIITNHPNCKIWMSSTPIGKREKFYNTCHNPNWKEFHYPSSINPMWGPELEATLREGLTSLGWIHEVEADFGEMEQGVFQHMYVKAAQRGYTYGDFAPDLNWEYTLGVDWNDTANGTTIAVIGYDKVHSQYYIVDTSIVKREGWTQLKACEEIIRLNRFWKPIAIYLDKGHGGTQWELLRRFGFAALRDKRRGPHHPDAKLIKAVPFDFGSTVETRDPFTKKKIQKPAKGFLVENAVRFFENGIIGYPGSDDSLTRQIQGYKIDRVSDSGRAIFKSGEAGDHLLDAVMLALVAYALENSAIGKPKFNSHIEFAPPLSGTASSKNGDKTRSSDTSKPDMERTDNIELKSPSTTTGLPAAHVPQEGHEHVWAWPGFLRDEPPPSSMTPLFKNRKGGILRRGLFTNRPRRRNI